jgi:hypothetical protein
MPNQKNKKNKTQAQVKKPKAKPSRPKRLFNPLSESDKCLSNYVKSLHDPKNSVPACIPIFPAVDSYKLKTFVRTSAATGGSGFGCIMLCPNKGVYNNSTCLRVSGAGNTAIVSTVLNHVNYLYTTYSANSPFDTTQMGDGADKMQCRLVSACLRIRYTGTQFNMGGTMTAAVSPRHETWFSSVYNAADISALKGARKIPITDKWVELLWFPVDRTELDFKDPIVDNLLLDNESMILHLQTPAVNQPFEVECFMNYEVIGRDARGQTPSFASSKFDEAVGMLHGGGDTTQGAKSSFDQIRDVFNTGRQIVGAAKTAYDMYNVFTSNGDFYADYNTLEY